MLASQDSLHSGGGATRRGALKITKMWHQQFLLVTAFLSCCTGQMAIATPVNLQPSMELVEWDLQQMSYGSISMAGGSPWCGGNKTVWSVAHQPDETPWCYNAETGTWSRPGIAVLESIDPVDGSKPDRHDCTTLDVNKDGLVDIICVVGAKEGTGAGYNELYFTQPDGSVEKQARHAMQYIPTVRTRLVETIHSNDFGIESRFIIVGASSMPRDDGFENHHYMYKVLDESPWFARIPGAWEEPTVGSQPNIARHIHVANWNGDGREDFIICHDKTEPMIFEQVSDGSFLRLFPPVTDLTQYWQSASVADVNGDGLPDLITASRWFKNDANKWIKPQLRIFPSVNSTDRWDFTAPYFVAPLPYVSFDMEVLDANNDGLTDIYVIQTAKKAGSYCKVAMPWSLRHSGPDASFIGGPPGYVAPLNEGKDLLFVSNGDAATTKFSKVVMEHDLVGCGCRVELFGNKQTLLLINGDADRFGPTAILSW